MSLLKKNPNVKPLRVTGGTATMQSSLRPKQVIKEAPCGAECPTGNSIRDWLQVIAQRDKLKLGEDEAFKKAWRIIVETNPFPSVTGRVCPHPCETACNRSAKDGAVSINVCERFLGDYALEKKWPLTCEEAIRPSDSVGVVGAGPSGLSFAYQMAKRGFAVTVYEKSQKPGGMMQWGIPAFRCPENILLAEVSRIEDLGVEINYGVEIGKDISWDRLRADHKALFVGIGADRSRGLGIPGEEGDGVFSGVDFLRAVRMGDITSIGDKVIVIGGGNTAVDAARTARRLGAVEVSILYRRTRADMPAWEEELIAAEEEGIVIKTEAQPISVNRETGRLIGMSFKKGSFNKAEGALSRDGETFDVAADAVITAVYREPASDSLSGLMSPGVWVAVNDEWRAAPEVFAGGDAVRIGLVSDALGHGRMAAIFADAALRGSSPKLPDKRPAVAKDRIKLAADDIYPLKARAKGREVSMPERTSNLTLETALGISKEEFLAEMTRCFSCGQCFGCERCFMFCTPGCFKKAEGIAPGDPYYKMKLETCDGCKKCDAECPCGYIDMA
jgi:NADPH-dependent glutamate synthase beta subunit-like oxidoreductase/Pyruvate/2-oxoacid:ferredoxin oxidoreductase delta subunit